MNGEAQVREIVDSYTPLVRATARRYEGRGADYEDLVQEGYLALLILCLLYTSTPRTYPRHRSIDPSAFLRLSAP